MKIFSKNRLKIDTLMVQELYIMIAIYCMAIPYRKADCLVAVVPCVIVTRRETSLAVRARRNHLKTLRVLPVNGIANSCRIYALLILLSSWISSPCACCHDYSEQYIYWVFDDERWLIRLMIWLISLFYRIESFVTKSFLCNILDKCDANRFPLRRIGQNISRNNKKLIIFVNYICILFSLSLSLFGHL